MKRQVKRLFIIAGANGTGKSTLAGEFLREFRLTYLNADDFARRLSGKGGDISAVRIKAGKTFFLEMNRLIRRGTSFALESTLSGRYLARTVTRVKKKGYRVSIIYFFVDNPEVAIDRIRVRVEKGGHYVPDVDVIRRFWRSKNNFWKMYRYIADDWRLFYNSKQQLAEVARGSEDRSEILERDLFGVFLEGIDAE